MLRPFFCFPDAVILQWTLR